MHAPGKVDIKATMKSWTGPQNADTPGLEFAKAAVNMPKQDLSVTMVDGNNDSPKGEAVKLVDGEGKEHLLSLSSAPAKAEKFKAGMAHARQTKRSA